MEKEFVNKLMEGIANIISERDKDLMIYGNAYLEIGKRGIRLVDPLKVIHTIRKADEKISMYGSAQKRSDVPKGE